ncbi:Protein of unknown function DUF4078 [Phaffia rhodozyma]|uniref:Uncharacterized protein n=1 Tax=Phaffia rhodozyma TaxID=264483 RepID=A0A0F7SI90_PHARH|nr:Protein of unknown function DUF4078 [Phaffia rhodozyma]
MSTSSSAGKKPSTKYNIVNANSLFDLKAELEKGKEKAQNRSSGDGSSYVRGVQREGKKPTKWSAPSKGLASRQARQDALSASSSRLGQIDRATLEDSQAALERKSKIYERLKRGKTGGLSSRQIGDALVDWDKKLEEDDRSSSGSENEEDEAPTADDPLTDYEDDLGRTRSVRRSEVPIYAMEKKRLAKAALEERPANLIIGDQNYFPVYEPSAEDLRARWEAAEEESGEKHYDANADVRNRSAAFYQFSKDSATRAQQQAELAAARLETEAARLDVEVHQEDTSYGMSPDPRQIVFGGKSVEKRKREVEGRRRLIEEKRQRKQAETFLRSLERELVSHQPLSGST